MRKLIVCLFACLVLGCGSDVHAQACGGLDKDGKKALQYLIDYEYGVGTAGREDSEDRQWARRIVLERGQKILSCLVEIYRHGQHKDDLWSGEGNRPTTGKWAVILIRQIDPKTAVPLYRELRAEAGDDLTRVQMGAE